MTIEERQGAIAHYHALLEGDAALARASADLLAERQPRERLAFGDRVLCKSLRPQFLTRRQYERVCSVCGLLAVAMFRLGRQMLEEPALLEAVDPTDAERRLLAVDPGFHEVSPTSRLDAFLAGDTLQFVEYNAECPAAIAYEDGLSRLFLDLPVMREFCRTYGVRPIYARHRLVEVLRDAYAQFERAYPRRAGSAGQPPVVAIVDWKGVPTATEFALCQEYFEENGLRTIVVDPRDLDYDGRVLRGEGTAIDLVYRRVLTSELLEMPGAAEPLVRAYEDHRVCVVNSFRAKLLHKKLIFALLSDEAYRPLFSDEEWQACSRYIPWTRKVREGRTTYSGNHIDLLDYVVSHKDTLVLKPNDDYGGKGITIGWQATDAQWAAALQAALNDSYVVQERVAVAREPYPLYNAAGSGLVFADLSADLDPFVFQTTVTGMLTRLSAAALLNVTAGHGSTVPTFVLEGD